MTKLLLKNKLKPKYLLLISSILSIIVSISYISTYMNYKSRIEIYNSNAADINLKYLKETIDATSGLTYFFEFLFSSDVMVIFFIFFAVLSVALFGVDLINDINNGKGNLIVSRIGYKNYLKSNIKAQVIFNYSYLILYFSLLFFLSYIINGNFNLEYGLGVGSIEILKFNSVLAYFLVMLIKVTIFSTVITLITLISSMSYLYIKNKFFVHLFPVIYYVGILIGANLLLNLIPEANSLFEIFILDVLIIDIMKSYLIAGSENIIKVIIFIIFMSLASIVLYKKNILRFKKEYIL